jgi:hypothetical protein
LAFTLPEFNVSVGLWRGPWLSKVAVAVIDANVSLGRRVIQQFQDLDIAQSVIGTPQTLLLMPASTDVRSRIAAPANDLFEIPNGSGRWYEVNSVEVVAMGFANEHVVAVVTQVSANVDPVKYAGLFWPLPMT